MTFDSTTDAARLQPIRIEWRDEPGPLTVVFFRQKPAPVSICGAANRFRRPGFASALGLRLVRGRSQPRRRRSFSGFTLLELLVVLGIIGLLASLTLPHLRGFTKSNAMNAATQQMLDDIAYARQRAAANRSTVYMVFVPQQPWNFLSQQALNNNTISGNTLTNLIQSQYRGYALVSLRTVGDQPGQWHPSFITDWKMLPSGVMFAPHQFIPTNQPVWQGFVYTTNTIANTRNTFYIYSLTNCVTRSLPFPSLETYVGGLPYIAFSPNGSLVDENGNPVQDQYIMLTSGGILYPSDNNGLLFQPPLVSESPLGESTNNANIIHINSTTARATVEHNRL